MTRKNTRNVFNVMVTSLVLIALGLTTPLGVQADISYIDYFTSAPFGGNPASFTTGSAATGLSYVCSGGDGCSFGYATFAGEGNSPRIDVASSSYNAGTTETVTITSRDGRAFSFVSIWIDNDGGGAAITITGYGPEPFTINVPASTGGMTYSPSGGNKLVTRVELTSNDFWSTLIDTVSTVLDVPGMDVQGNGITIANGDSTPAAADGTDLGSTSVGTPITQNFVIRSIGDDPLDLTGAPYVSISGSADLTISVQPTTDPIPSGGSDSFTVRCNPSGTGVRTATVSINNNSEAHPYTFVVQCTGTSAPSAIIIEKQTDPDGAPDSFEFSTDYGPNFTLADDETHNSGPLTPGTYAVSEVNIPAGWSLTSATCDDGSDPSAIGLDPGETVTCTFYNTQERGAIIVEKQTDPDGAPDSFTFSGDAAGSIADNGTIEVNDLLPGAYTSQETVPAGWELTNIECDDDNSTVSLADFRANFQLEAGETIRCTFYNRLPLDYGDAPDPTYPTLLASNGARHAIVPGHSLGPMVDAEPDGQPSPLADGDDLNGVPDDEDGVTLPPAFTAGDPAATVIVDGGPSGGMLDAWIDFNDNGVFDHPAEHLWDGTSQLLAATPTPNNLTFAVPAGAIPGQTYARFRLSDAGGLPPTGFAPDGEVEDYLVTLENPPTITINDVTVDEGTGTATFTVTLSTASGLDVDVDYATYDGTAAAPGDYTAIPTTTLTISAGATTGNVVVTINEDTLDENSETFTVTLSAPVNATIADGEGIGTITDNDDSPTLSIGDVTVDEGAGSATFTATLSTVSGLDVDVSYATSDGTAVAGQDYTAVASALTILAGDTTSNVAVSISNDTLDENSETFTVTLSAPVNATIADDEGIGTITDNDDPPTLSINDVLVNETGGMATFTVTLSAASSFDVDVDYATRDGTALAPGDYTAIATQTLNIPAGAATGNVVVTINDDALTEGLESFYVHLGNPVNATIADGEGECTIVDDDGMTILTINDVTVGEGASTAVFTVTLSSASGVDVGVDYATSDGSATAGDDYSAASGRLTVTAGSLTGNVAVTILEDGLDESNETFSVTLSNPTNATIADGEGIGTITDNDVADVPGVTITESGASTDVAEGGASDSYQVVLNAQPSAAVTVTVSPDAQTFVTPTIMVFTPDYWDMPQLVNVNAVDDAVIEGPHTGAITHSASSADGAYNGISISGVTVNITDNDGPGVTITESGGSTDVAEGGATDSYEVVLNAQPSAAVTVTVSPDSQTFVTPTIMVFTSGDWDTPQTVFVIAIDDDVAEGSHTGTISHSASSADGDYDGISIPDVTVNITDNEQVFFYLPLALVNHVVAPDLVITSLVVTSNNVTLVVENQGNAPITDEFWVDVYVNPDSTPEVNQYWSLIADQGLVWGLTTDILDSLAPGGAITLTLNDAYFQPEWSSVSWPLDVGTTVYAQVDSYGDYVFGAVRENHEVITGGVYNNVAVTTSVATLSASEGERPVWPRANRR